MDVISLVPRVPFLLLLVRLYITLHYITLGGERSARPLQAVATVAGASRSSLGGGLDAGRVPRQVRSHRGNEFAPGQRRASARHSRRGSAADAGQDERHE